MREKVASVMGAPLVLRGRTIGVVHVGSFVKREFAPPDLVLLQLVTDRVALVLERTQLYQAERQSREQAERDQKRFAFLAEASRVLTASLDYRTTLASVARQAVPYMATWCIVDVLEVDGSNSAPGGCRSRSSVISPCRGDAAAIPARRKRRSGTQAST